ncbi:CDP-glycerol glycerophosphotransferase family protein [Bacillus kwashiorkori]|uniref:CDP-glycerol glycerophosphotransferase family protein n=1 Tax=Bacillus kwashiorkori TaxID=1522318 RepID=UPI0007861890|nr:CDP-glycerol glycerophosphotransferase family protein [Bacillus kwashiorkori]
MVREIAIQLYLFVFKILFNIAKIFTLQEKIVFVTSFPENNIAVNEALKKKNNSLQTVFLCRKNCYQSVKAESTTANAYYFETPNIKHSILSIYHLATAKIVIVDNYYGFLATVKFKKSVQCIQVWHAAGAIKKFGLEDESNKYRSPKAMKRFKKVYQQFHKVLVGSEKMATIFQKAFGLAEENMLPLGIPRTDFFYDERKHEQIRKQFYEAYPELKGKKIILYAPTFRDEEQTIAIHIEKFKAGLGEKFALLFRLHPLVANALNINNDGFVYNFSSYPKVNDLLIIADYLITDYSSIPYEFALLEKPMIFYPYDIEKYTEKRGLWGEYEHLVPGPVVYSSEEIIKVILTNNYDLEKISQFKNEWNTYSQGHSSDRFGQYLLKSVQLETKQAH